MDRQATIYVVDDDSAIRDSLRLLFETVGLTVETHADAQSFLDDFNPDQESCLLLDVRMPGMSGLALQSKLIEMNAPVPIIIMTAHADVPMAVRAMKQGVVDFIEKPFRDQQLIETVFSALDRFKKQRKKYRAKQIFEQSSQILTPREQEILSLLTDGKTNKQIASELGISYKTADFHRQNILKKMQISSVIELTQMKILAEQIES